MLAARNALNSWGLPSLTEKITSAPVTTLLGRQLDLFTGNTLGGTSAINAGQWMVPETGTAASWGLTGLDEKKEREIFDKAREAVNPQVPGENIKEQYINFFREAAAKQGLDFLADDADTVTGEPRDMTFWYNRLTFTQGSGIRFNSFLAYLAPALAGPCAGRVDVRQGVTVTKFVIESERVTGVEYEDVDGSSGTILANKEVISSAGPYHSPKLLQLSGVGPKSLLDSKNISVKVDLPVGLSASTRARTSVVHFYFGVPLVDANNVTMLLNPAEAEKFENREPSLFGVAVSALNGFLGKLGYFEFGNILPWDPSGAGNSVTTEFDPSNIAPDLPILASTCLGNPESESVTTISIENANTATPLNVNLGILSTKEELENLKTCINLLERIGEGYAPAFAAMEILPGNLTTESFIRSQTDSAYHLVGGSAVGSVLDEKLVVKGIRNLRVVDASAIPKMPPSAGPMSSVYALSEYAAELIASAYPERINADCD